MRSRAYRSPLLWLGALLALYLLLPVFAFVVRFFRSGPLPSTPGLWGSLWVSAISATISVSLIALLGIPLAYVLARSDGRIARAVGVGVYFPLALPPLMSGVLLIFVVGPYTPLGRLFHGSLTNTMTGIVIAQTFVAAPFLIVAARAAFAATDPAMEDVAATLGRHQLSRFFGVSLPAARSGIRDGLLLSWLRAFGEYGATVILSYHPYSLPVFNDVELSATGLRATLAPTMLALGVAATLVALDRFRPRLRRRPVAVLPTPAEPAASPVTPVSFDISAQVGSFRLNLSHIATSQRLAILGPSGSGKSMMLRCLAGLMGPDVGPVSFAGEAVGRFLVEDRGVGYVPQSTGLFPHLTVWQHLCFAPGADAAVASWWLSALHLDGLQDRLPAELSGGQRQRVSLARALSRGPRLVLLDEPFSALDAPVRDELRRELRRVQRLTGLSSVLVTHDPEEAALLADEVVVMDEGRMLQAGPLRDVFARPASPQVARLLGIQNLYRANVTSGSEIALDGGVRLAVGDHGLATGAPVLWCIRPEHVVVGHAGYAGEVLDVVDMGASAAVSIRLAEGPELRAAAIQALALEPGQRVRVELPADRITVWPEDDLDPVPAGSAVPDRSDRMAGWEGAAAEASHVP